MSNAQIASLFHRDPLTLASAIEVLNRFKHDGYTDWYAWTEYWAACSEHSRNMTAFEAIATAEKYLRDVCDCPCHKDSAVMHFMPCCETCKVCQMRILTSAVKMHASEHSNSAEG